jgi:hypothetical protein
MFDSPPQLCRLAPLDMEDTQPTPEQMDRILQRFLRGEGGPA